MPRQSPLQGRHAVRQVGPSSPTQWRARRSVRVSTALWRPACMQGATPGCQGYLKPSTAQLQSPRVFYHIWRSPLLQQNRPFILAWWVEIFFFQYSSSSNSILLISFKIALAPIFILVMYVEKTWFFSSNWCHKLDIKGTYFSFDFYIFAFLFYIMQFLKIYQRNCFHFFY